MTTSFAEHGVVEITVTVQNTGERSGKDVVQVYVGECPPRVPRPKRELKAFAKVALEPGESKPSSSRSVGVTSRSTTWWPDHG